MAGVDSAVADVVRDGVVEERCILRDNTDSLTQRFEGDVTDILSINKNTTRLRIIETEEETEDGRLAVRLLAVFSKHSVTS